MDRVGIAPKREVLEAPTTDNWFRTVTQRMNLYTGTSNPTVAESPENQPFWYLNTSLNEVRIWVNVAGTMKKSAALT